MLAWRSLCRSFGDPMLDSARLVLMMSVLFVVAATSGANAGWAPDGLPIAPHLGGDPGEPQIASDSLGGSIMVWQDDRSGNGDIYAQRIDAGGAPLWTVDGVVVCTASGTQSDPVIISDGAGGAIIMWQDRRWGGYDIYAQRIDASGTPLWTADGVAVCTAANSQWFLQITSDGAGGAIVTWEDFRSGNNDIYAQRIDASGAPLWTADGVAVCTAAQTQSNPELISDGAGGAIVTWRDRRSGSYDIYAQRIDAGGTPLWTADGVAVCTALGSEGSPDIISDGAAGAIVTWEDFRGGNVLENAKRPEA